MPIDSALVAARLGKPGDLRHSVTDRDQRPREGARRSRGALAASSCSTYRFPPWERVFADIKQNVQPLADDFSSFCSIHFEKWQHLFWIPKLNLCFFAAAR